MHRKLLLSNWSCPVLSQLLCSGSLWQHYSSLFTISWLQGSTQTYIPNGLILSTTNFNPLMHLTVGTVFKNNPTKSTTKQTKSVKQMPGSSKVFKKKFSVFRGTAFKKWISFRMINSSFHIKNISYLAALQNMLHSIAQYSQWFLLKIQNIIWQVYWFFFWCLNFLWP